MKIVHVEDYFDPTAGYQINELLNVSNNLNDDIYLITSNDMTPFHKSIDKNEDLLFEKRTGVKVIRLDVKFCICSRIILNGLWNKIDNINPDFVFLHGVGDFKDIKLLNKKKNYKMVRDCHMSWVASKNRFAKVYYRLYSLLFGRIINNSNKYEKVFALGIEEYEYLKALGINDEKIDYLYHGYNKEIMHYDKKGRDEIREFYKVKDEDILISYIGKFNYAKRPDIIIDIINKLDEKVIEDNNIKLLFIGSKDEKFMSLFDNKLKTINSKVEFIVDTSKPFKELKKYFSASDICIFPKETTLSSIHAQVCRCPVVMEKYKSNMERVVNNSNLYDIDDLKEAANIINNIITIEEYKKENNKFDKILDKREYTNQVRKLESYYRLL